MAISVGGAVGAGFGLVGRRPWAVLGWGLFCCLAFVVLIAVAIAVFGVSIFASLPGFAPGATPTPADMLRLVGAVWPMILIFYLGQLLITAVMQGAVFRSILRPDDRGFMSIRVGVEEGVLFLLTLLLFVLNIGVELVTLFVAFPVAAIAGHAIGGIGGGLVTFLLIVAWVVLLAWLSLRFALAGPLSFAERRVRFFGAWELSRGEGWRLFGLGCLLALIMLGLMIVFYILLLIVVVIVSVAGFASMAAASGGVQGIAQNPSALMAMWPLGLLLFFIYLAFASAFIGGVQAIILAPWAEAYRQLRGSPDVAATFS